jgi:predicted metal-binding membrane protein
MEAAYKQRDDQKFFTILIVVLIVLSWLTLWFLGTSPYGRFVIHQDAGEVSYSIGHGGNYFFLVIIFVISWTLMIVAMMLPTSIPLVNIFRIMISDRANRAQLIFLLIAGYLSMWMLFGVIAHIGDWGIHQAFMQRTWLHSNAWMIGAATLMLAGLYQFTPLKYNCLDKCRSPRSFIMGRWKGGNEQLQSFRLGMDHGIFCIGCCWTLMLLMFTVGVGNIGWMLVLGTVMTIEKNMSWGRQISAPLGMILLLWGLILVGMNWNII